MLAVIIGAVALLVMVPLMKKFNAYVQQKNEQILKDREEKKKAKQK